MSGVKAGQTVTIHFCGRCEDGTVFEQSEPDEPLVFEAGSEEVLPGISEAVIGMQVGEKRLVDVPPEKGFGEYQDDLEQRVPLTELPEGIQVGDELTATGDDEDDEDEFPVWVVEITETDALLDANHPLAGETLTFEIELVAVE